MKVAALKRSRLVLITGEDSQAANLPAVGGNATACRTRPIFKTEGLEKRGPGHSAEAPGSTRVLLELEPQFVQRRVLELDRQLAATRPARGGLPVVGESARTGVETDAGGASRGVVQRHRCVAAARERAHGGRRE